MKKFICLYLFSISFAGIIKPQYGDTLNYRDVLVQWEQVPDAVEYELEIYDSSEQLLITIVDSSLITFVLGIFDWNSNYQLVLNSFGSNMDSLSTDTSILYMNRLTIRDFLPLTTNFVNSESYSEGYTVMDDVVIDKFGEVVLFMPTNSNGGHFTFTNQLENGDFLGIGYGGSVGGCILNREGEILYDTISEIGNVHHDFFPMGNGNFIGLVVGIDVNDIPEGPWEDQFAENGISTLRWKYDDIVEVDAMGNEIWRWSTNDHFSKEDFDPNWFNVNNLINNAPNPVFDWTHSNAVFFDPIESMIYLSSRHLSRITKISYPEGQIVWMIGKEFTDSGVLFDEQLQISSQHAIKLLDNGNLMLFNNGNHNIPQLSSCIEFQIEENNNQLSYNLVWEHILEPENYSSRLGDCDRLPNGNSLLTSGDVGYAIEVDGNNNVVWDARANYQQNGPHITYYDFYRSERIDGLYPLAYSVMIENFKKILDENYIYLPIGESNFSFKIFNEGHSPFVYSYHVSDELGILDYWAEVHIEENSYVEVLIPLNIPLDMSNNQFDVFVEPISVYPTESTNLSFIANSCDTNPNYIFSDMGDCPNNILYGDMNQDGLLNVLDIVNLVNDILNPDESTEFQLIIGDMNQDGLLNVLDIVNLVNLILA